MTKRDTADIAIVWMGLSFLLSFLSSIAFFLARVFTDETPNFVWGAPLALTLFQIVVMFLMTFVLLFKRRCVLDLLFPLAGQTEMAVSDGCAALTELAFWIRLFGTFTLIEAVIKLVANLAQYFPAKHSTLGVGFVWTTVTPSLMTIPLALLAVWQADRIAALMNKLGKSNKTGGR